MELSFPVRAAFFHLDYPFNWTVNGQSAAHETPSAGRYTSIDALDRQLEDFEYARIDVAMTYWWGNGSPTDAALARFLVSSERSNLRWSVVYMRERADHPFGKDLELFLADFRIKFAATPNFFRVSGKPVLFVDSDDTTPTCELADRWVGANASKDAGVYLVLRPSAAMAGGFAACASQPSAWLPYDAAEPERAAPNSFAVSPGAWKFNQAAPTLPRNPARFAASVQRMVASRSNLQLITTFNAWNDGSAVESATEWSSTSGHGVYLDILHTDGVAP